VEGGRWKRRTVQFLQHGIQFASSPLRHIWGSRRAREPLGVRVMELRSDIGLVLLLVAIS
jgi:hypothetical protein